MISPEPVGVTEYIMSPLVSSGVSRGVNETCVDSNVYFSLYFMTEQHLFVETVITSGMVRCRFITIYVTLFLKLECQ